MEKKWFFSKRRVFVIVLVIVAIFIVGRYKNTPSNPLRRTAQDSVSTKQVGVLTKEDRKNLRIVNAKRRNLEALEILSDVKASLDAGAFETYTGRESHRWMDLFPITYDCDMYDMKRIGVQLPDDGGKWLCDEFGLQEMKGCHVFSLGSNNDYSYEEAIHKQYPQCTIDV